MNERVGQDSGILNQGPWVKAYSFPPKTKGTSCTVVNPFIMKSGKAVNSTIRWSFNVGPAHPPGNVAWYYASKDYVPSVGDTYIVLNPYRQPSYGHVGIVLHVPPDGNGLWITADGGQGGKPRQLAILVPRWGIMGKHLPKTGAPPGAYKDMVDEPDGGPFLAGATAGDLHTAAKIPADGDIQGIIDRIVFRQTFKEEEVSCPRRMEGFADVDHPRLSFPQVDGKPPDDKLLAACTDLQGKVNAVIAAYRAGGIIGGTGT